MRLTISKRLILGNLIGCAALVALIFMVLKNASRSEQEAVHTRDEAAVYALKARELQIESIQVQQWLQDISATRAATGFDDGFKFAEEHADRFRQLLSEFEQLYGGKKDFSQQAFVAELRSAFEDYYKLGRTMAQAYIEGGPEGGNPLMKDFDPAAEKINTKLDELVAYHNRGLDQAMGNVIAAAQSNVRSGWLFGGLGILVALGAGVWFLDRLPVRWLRPYRQCSKSRKEMGI